MIGLGLNAAKTPTTNTNIVKSVDAGGGARGSSSSLVNALVLRHDYKDRPVELCSSGAASFDGTDDYVDLGSQSATADMTISAWIFKTDDNANPIIRYGKSLVRIENATHTIRFWADVAGASSSTSNVQENNVWQHWCFTVTGTTANVYKDGVFLESDTVAAVNTATSSSYIGRQANTDYFNGYICNVGVWSAVLTQPQIKSIMNKNYAALSASEKTNLVSWWNLDSTVDDLGTAVYDNHGGALGEEIVSNGDFSNGSTGWSKSSEATLFVSNGQLDIQSSSDSGEYGFAFSTINFVSGKSYLINFDVISTDVTDHIRVGSTNNLEGNPVNIFDSGDIGLGSHSLVYLATSDHVYLGFGGRNDMTTLVIDNVSVKLVNGNTGTLA